MSDQPQPQPEPQPQPQPPPSDWTSHRQWGEKAEKVEKEDEKAEKSQEEKNWDEKFRRDPINAIGWALVLIWAGLVFLMEDLGLLSALPSSIETWNLILLGVGVIVLLQVLIRLLVPAYRQPITGSLILAFVLIALGLGGLLPTGVLWAIVLITLGVIFLLRGLFHRR